MSDHPEGQNLSPSEQLTYNTVRIEVDYSDGSTGVGTGFFFAFLKTGDHQAPAIVTNKHVVQGSTTGRFRLHTSDGKGGVAAGQTVNVVVEDFEGRWLPHPDPDIDLCILPVAGLLESAEAKGTPAFFIQVDSTILPSEGDLSELTALEDVVMVGYPSGIWDAANNMPIIRRGITATHPATDYEGRPEFMIDAACFPGSSGSPVFLFNQTSYSPKSGGIVMGSRVKLLGILYAGPQFTAEGEVVVVTVPTQHQAIAVSKIPMNLGVVIKARCLLDFDNVLISVSQKASGNP